MRIRTGLAGVAGAVLAGSGVWLVLRPTVLPAGPPPMPWSECRPEQVEVMVLGTFHFDQQDEVDVLLPRRQEELEELVAGIAGFAPTRVAVEHPWARNASLNEAYRTYLVTAPERVTSRNETVQLGFRLARALGQDRVFGVDVPMELWHDSIRTFDERYPDARGRLRRRWDVRYPPSPSPDGDAPLAELLRTWNGEAPPGNAEYGLFLPLVEGDVYAGALKLRPWYDRNLRIVQNLFRVADGADDRLFLLVGGSHVRVLRQILDLTPQLCAVDPLPWIEGAGQSPEAEP